MALKYRWSLIGSILCSLLVAVMWGANIGAVYPLIEVVFNNNSVDEWIDQRIETSQGAIEQAESEIAALENQIGLTLGEDQAARQIAILNSRRRAEQGKLESSLKLKPWVEKYAPSTRFGALLWITGFLVLGTLIRSGALLGSMIMVARIGQKTILDMQQVLFRKALTMKRGDLDIEGAGDLISRIRGETSQISSAIQTIYGQTIREPLKMTACLVCAAYVNWRLLIFSLAICPIAVFMMLKIAKLTKRANKRAIEESAKLLGRLFQSISYRPAVVAFAMESHERMRFKQTAEVVYHKAIRIAGFTALARSNNELVGVSITCLTLLAGGYLVLNQQTHLFGVQLSATPMTNTEIMTFFAFLIGVSDPLRKMGNVFNQIQAGAVASERIFPLYDFKAEIANPKDPIDFPAGSPSIEFRDVHFGYEQNTPVLQGLSFSVPAGSSLAIVGSNGCGKSTLVNLLPRFHDANQGEVLINGRSTTKYRLKDLRRKIGLVTQQTMLFADSIGENIKYGSPRASDFEMIRAAKRAHADKFINQIEDGYEALVGEQGSTLSGGQRQRISLARVILKDPSILLLDEATSQIDPESEQLIHQSLKEFIQDRTTIIITHRLSTLDLVDRILVMDEGRVVDCGTHQELMSRSEAYRRIRNTELKEAA